MRSTSRRLRHRTLTLPDGWIEHIDLAASRAAYALPGLTAAGLTGLEE